MFQNLTYETEGAIAIIQLNRPQKKNSLNSELRREMGTTLREIEGDSSLKVVIVTGGEEIFCAGADITEIQEATSAESTYKHAREFQLLFDRIECLRQPVIAAVSGYALGGGCELALACDFRIACEGAQFGLPEIRIGAFPAGGGTQRLPRLIGVAKAKEMIFTGDPIGSDEALSLGLVMPFSITTILISVPFCPCRLCHDHNSLERIDQVHNTHALLWVLSPHLSLVA